MKKIITLLLVNLLFLLTSCKKKEITDIKNVIWKEEVFRIEATYTQLYNQRHGSNKEKDDYYSSLTIEEEDYYCCITLHRHYFFIDLIDKSSGNLIDFYGDEGGMFLSGKYDCIEKTKNCDYLYSVSINLDKEGQYYEYCKSNEKVFPEGITLYAYKTEE